MLSLGIQLFVYKFYATMRNFFQLYGPCPKSCGCNFSNLLPYTISLKAFGFSLRFMVCLQNFLMNQLYPGVFFWRHPLGAHIAIQWDLMNECSPQDI